MLIERGALMPGSCDYDCEKLQERPAKLAEVKVNGDEQIGVNIVKRPCEEPLRQIVGNAGFEGAIAAEIPEKKPPAPGPGGHDHGLDY
jgi:hypothetical protein